MNDHELAEYAMARTALVVTYDGNGQPVGSGRGTGFFYDAGDHQFAIMNTHLLEAYCSRRARGEDVRLQLSVESGKQGVEVHAGYLLMPTHADTDGAVSSRYAFKDIGLVALTPECASLVAKHKAFVRPAEVSTAPLEPGADVIFRGYPRNSVEFHGAIRGVWAEGYTHFTRVRRVTERNIAVERREGHISFGAGPADNERDVVSRAVPPPGRHALS